MSDTPKSLLQHIIELRTVLVKSAFSILLLMILSYIFMDEIFGFISAPLFKVLRISNISEKIIYTSVTEVFSTQLKLAFYSSLFISFPYILKQFWDFVKEGLLENELKIAKKLIIISPLFFIIGAAFAFYIVIPNVLLSLIKSSVNFANFLPKMNENISFIMIMIISFGISFQLPLLIFCLDKLSILTAKTLQKLWREFILVVVIISAIITPPDAFSMIFLAIPLILLYFISLIFCRIIR